MEDVKLCENRSFGDCSLLDGEGAAVVQACSSRGGPYSPRSPIPGRPPCHARYPDVEKAPPPTAPKSQLPTDSTARKNIPLARGCFDYFPAALAAVAQLSKAGNDKHNPGEEMHHARGKSGDHADCILRHLADRGTVDPEDNIRHCVKVAWRALALCQEELEREEGAPLARGARLPEETP